MLCGEHLAKHDRLIGKQTQLQNELLRLCNIYKKQFGDKIEKQFKNIEINISNHSKLLEEIEYLSSVNHFDDLMVKNEKLQTIIIFLQKSIAENSI